MVQQVLMPKATAAWLISNTTLTFDQIAKFCGLHLLEVQGIADGEVAVGIPEEKPIINGQLPRDEISRCEGSSTAELKLIEVEMSPMVGVKKARTYVPVAVRHKKPWAIVWLLKNYPEITDGQIIKLIGTTRHTINSLKDKQTWTAQHIKPADPVLLGLCSQIALNELVDAIEKGRQESASTEKSDTPVTDETDSDISRARTEMHTDVSEQDSDQESNNN